jgi:exodeoxyribonuclease V gamma subunit
VLHQQEGVVMSDKDVNADAVRGITIFRASRLEALLEPLLHLMESGAPADVLAPYIVVAAHPGIQQWLVRELARRRGAGSIVANVEIELPSAWLDDLAQRVLGESAVALRPYRRETLRWRIHECLDAIDDAQVNAYLRGNDIARRRFQLADRLARIYTRYLVYRPDWLKAWAAGRDDVPEKTFLAPLWRTLRKQIGMPHRGELLERLARALQRAAPAGLDDEPLHVFGISHLAPSELAILHAVARHRPVVLYLPDPCIKYWSGLRSDLARLRTLVALDALPADADELFLEQNHPLLASWGRIGQHLMLALSQGDDVRMDVWHWKDEEEPVETLTRLQGLQESLRRLDPVLIEPGQPGDADALADRSLRVHVCHTRLRELEVLRDALLRERLESPDLKPSDIVVMAPDIHAYVPLLGAVFGEAGRHDGPLPYNLADVAVSRSHRLFSAFETLLALPQSRLTAPEVMDLLEVPEIARALGLDQAGVDVLHGWLQRSRIAWALDPAFRESFGVPGIAEYTFAWGMDRLLGGYVFGESGEGACVAYTFDDGSSLLPIEGVNGPQAEVIGALDRLLQELAALRRDMRQTRSASQWGARLTRLIDALFRVDFGDDAAREALAQLHRFVHIIENETDEDALDPLLEFSVVREVLLERLAAAPQRQRFLIGGVTFCGMVPQRAIPFRVIAVLGLNDGDFPRAPSDGGLDLMARRPRIGDRDVRNDDRYLFLETVMSARDVLHLSYVGEGVRDARPRNPSTPLAELLNLLDERAGVRDTDEKKPDRPWLVKHPLQPFDKRYFDDSDPRLYSFRKDLADLASDAARSAHPFLAAHAGTFASAADETVLAPLAEVIAYYKDPARQVLRDRLHLRLDGTEDDSLRSSEPIDAGFERIERVARRVFLDVVGANGIEQPGREFVLPDAPPDWLRLDGLWPPGHVGEKAWRDEQKKIDGLLKIVAAHRLFAKGLPKATPLQVDRGIGRFRVQGELARVHFAADAAWLFEVFPEKKTEDDLTFRERIGVFLEWALLRLDETHRALPVRMLIPLVGQTPWQDGLNGWDDTFMAARGAGDEAAATRMLAEIERRIEGLFAFWAEAQSQPSWYFPSTSWEVSGAKDIPDVENAWAGSFRRGGERNREPGYAALLARDARFEKGHVDEELLTRNARALFALISLDASEGMRDD